jgi:uncharacterized membrane protein YkvA (DUF1232 family)
VRNPLRAWLDRVRALRREALALWYAARDPRTPWYAKAIALVVVGYAFSPLDLIPDFVPVLGPLDDLLIVAGGVYVLLRIIPDEVLAEARERAHEAEGEPRNWFVAVLVVVAYVLLALVALWLLTRLL